MGRGKGHSGQVVGLDTKKLRRFWRLLCGAYSDIYYKALLRRREVVASLHEIRSSIKFLTKSHKRDLRALSPKSATEYLVSAPHGFRTAFTINKPVKNATRFRPYVYSRFWALHDSDEAAMWGAIDSSVGPGAAKGLPINVLTDTAAILYRAELAGVSVAPERWVALSEYAKRFFPDTGQSFADFHAALAHAMAGNGDHLAHISDTAKGFAGDLVRPVARAWGAIARQDWDTALTELVQVMGSTERLGGSRAQRDLLELTNANVLLKLGQTAEARRSLTTRRPVLAHSPPLAAFHS